MQETVAVQALERVLAGPRTENQESVATQQEKGLEMTAAAQALERRSHRYSVNDLNKIFHI